MGLVRTWRDLARAFTQTRRLGPGRLRITRPDGTAREIVAFYEDGFVGEPGGGWLEDTAVLQLFCPDPYWRDLSEQTVTRTFGESVNFYDPFMSISSGQVLGETTIDNAGSVEVWPVWIIRGPASLITATSHTMGETFVIDPDWDDGGPLSGDDTITVTTDPPGVIGPSGEVWTGALNWPNAQLWGLAPGINHIDFAVAGAAAGTQIALTWRTRHETP